MAYNPTLNEYLVVWDGDDEPPGEGELEIFGQRLDAGTDTELGKSDFRISDD